MADRLTRGFIAGIIGGIAANAFNLFLGAAGLSTLRFIDWTGIVMYDHTPPFTLGEILFAFMGQLIFTGGLGVMFIFLIPSLNSRNLLFKGWLWGVSIWFIIDGITTLFPVEGTSPTPLITSIANYMTASVYGLMLAPILARFEHTRQASLSLMPAPAAKQLDDNKDLKEEENRSQEK